MSINLKEVFASLQDIIARLKIVHRKEGMPGIFSAMFIASYKSCALDQAATLNNI